MWPRGASHRKCKFGPPESLFWPPASRHFWVALITMSAFIFCTDCRNTVHSSLIDRYGLWFNKPVVLLLVFE